MKETITWQGEKFELEWIESEDIDYLDNITQVYGFLVDGGSKLCVVRPTSERGWRLPGGGPEEGESWQETLIREADEEADIELDKNSLKLIGYLKVKPLSSSDKGVHFLLRAVGKITKINEQTEDIAEGLINEREFIPIDKFLEYCPWGESGKVQLEKAREELGLRIISS